MNTINQNLSKINIAIDGFSACGKSTLAHALAAHFSYVFIDTGAMYRAVAFYFIQKYPNLKKNTDFTTTDLEQELSQINISFYRKGHENVLRLNGQEMGSALRSIEVANIVSAISSIEAVRKKLLVLQQNLTLQKGVVMDGRDIGTCVIPDAAVKLFLTASIDKRTERRYQELQTQSPAISIDEVRKNLLDRDFQDANRLHSPLQQAQDAVVVDNTNLTIQEQFLMLVAFIECRIKHHNV